MFRLFIVLFLAFCIAGGVAFSTGLLDEFIPTQADRHSPPPAKSRGELGELLYPAQPFPEPVKPAPRAYSYLPVEAYVVARDKQDVASPKDGKLLVVGQVVEDNTPKNWIPNRPLEPFKIPIGTENKPAEYQICRWMEGDRVEPGQMLAFIDPAMTIIEIESKRAKLKLAKADEEESKLIYAEMKEKMAKLDRLKSQPGKLVTDQEWYDAKTQEAKYHGEVFVKNAAIDVAKAELSQAETAYLQCILRNELGGACRIKKIYKTSGEGLKAQDPVLQIYNVSRMRIEGSVDSQYYAKLKEHQNAGCFLEPSVEIGPTRDLLKFHRDEVTGVATCADGEHFVSGSKDKTVRVWKRDRDQPVRELLHKSAVRSVATSPKDALVAVGCADGSITIWNLREKDAEPVEFKEQHQGNVTSLAFSPDGTYLASGGEDYAINLWNAATGEKLYPFDPDHGVDDPHQGTVTSLTFTPQCKLVSAARDGSLRVWSLHKRGAILDGSKIDNRGGTVNQLGVSSDGQYMLFDKGRILQILNVADGATVSVLDNLGAAPFDTLALFSPDGTQMLTGGAGDGRLHLWKAPTPDDRGYQIRELVVKDRSPIVAAAFGPAGHRFAVTGTLDGYVQLWDLPQAADAANHRILVDANNEPLRLALIEPVLEGNKSRIAVDVVNPQERLMPGQRVTLVVVLPQTGN